MTIAQAASKTLKKLKEVGWCKHTFNKYDETGKVVGHCIMGAIEVALSESQAGKLEAYLRSKIGNSSLGKWNDHPSTTKKDVFKLLRSATQVRGK